MTQSIGIIGCGHLGRIISSAYQNGVLSGYTLKGAYSHKLIDAEELCKGTDGIACSTIDELLALKPDFLVETASVAIAKDVSIKALKMGISFIPLSVGAFADPEFYQEAQAAAIEGSSRLYIPSGAVGGFDMFRTVSLMAEAEHLPLKTGIATRKGPVSLKNTPLYEESLEHTEKEVLHGTAEEAIKVLPAKVNVAVASSLASSDPQHMSVSIISEPCFIGDDHCITVEMEGIKATADIWSAKSDIAAWSVVALLRNLASPAVFF